MLARRKAKRSQVAEGVEDGLTLTVRFACPTACLFGLNRKSRPSGNCYTLLRTSILLFMYRVLSVLLGNYHKLGVSVIHSSDGGYIYSPARSSKQGPGKDREITKGVL